jgi:hypothetical protein
MAVNHSTIRLTEALVKLKRSAVSFTDLAATLKTDGRLDSAARSVLAIVAKIQRSGALEAAERIEREMKARQQKVTHG